VRSNLRSTRKKKGKKKEATHPHIRKETRTITGGFPVEHIVDFHRQAKIFKDLTSHQLFLLFNFCWPGSSLFTRTKSILSLHVIAPTDNIFIEKVCLSD
jgi:hypothetical protein